MASLPTVGASDGTWGTELNAFLGVEHNADGTHTSLWPGFGETTDSDDDGNAMVVAHAYLANQDGMVTVVITLSSTLDVIGYVDSDANPASGGTIMGRWKVSTYASNNDVQSFMFPVQSGKYFEITASGGATCSIYWTPIGTLVEPTDQD